MELCIGIISYLPDDLEVREVRIKRLESLLNSCDIHFKLPIIIVAQNWNEYSLPKIFNSKIIIYKYKNKLGITRARSELRNLFLESEFSHIIMLDDDMELSKNQKDFDYYLDTIRSKPEIDYFYIENYLNNFCTLTKRGFFKVDYDLNVNPENGTGFEDWIFSVKCNKVLPNYKMASNLPLKPRKEFLNDKYTTWDPKSEKLSISNNLISKEIIKKIRNS